MNTVTNQVLNDHPLDDHYRKLVKEAKSNKKNPQKATFLNKYEDPLIRAETEKKVKE
jgi:hypothetical protein